MEVMPYRPEVDAGSQEWLAALPLTHAEWQAGLPVLHGPGVTLRELRHEDAASLCALLTTEEVTRFISPPPSTVAGFERFLAWTHRQRADGGYACFAVVPDGTDTAVGVFQIRLVDTAAQTAEWGFALGSSYWGTGLFPASARLVVDFALQTLGVRRLEARSTLANGRGNGALRKIGAVRAGILRRTFERDGKYFDQALWVIARRDWQHDWPPTPLDTRHAIH